MQINVIRIAVAETEARSQGTDGNLCTLALQNDFYIGSSNDKARKSITYHSGFGFDPNNSLELPDLELP